MKNKLMSSILICIICVSCLVLFGCTGGTTAPLRSKMPEEIFDEMVAWGPKSAYDINEDGYMYEFSKYFHYEDICELGIVSNDDLNKLKSYESIMGDRFDFELSFGIKDGEDRVCFGFPFAYYYERDTMERIFASTLDFKFADVVAEMEELTGIEMTQEILNPEIKYYEAKILNEETNEYESIIYPPGINFNILKDSEYIFDFVYIDDNLIEYHVYR